MEADVTAAALERAIVFVREEEQKRILKLFHDKVVPHLVAAMFEAQFVKEELESRGLQEGEALSRMIEPKYGDGIEWKLKQDVDFLRDA
jgi:signal transduction histidine kinase